VNSSFLLRGLLSASLTKRRRRRRRDALFQRRISCRRPIDGDHTKELSAPTDQEQRRTCEPVSSSLGAGTSTEDRSHIAVDFGLGCRSLLSPWEHPFEYASRSSHLVFRRSGGSTRNGGWRQLETRYYLCLYLWTLALMILLCNLGCLDIRPPVTRMLC